MKFVMWLGLIALGAALTTLIDACLGIDLSKTVGSVPARVHEVTYMVWGAAILKIGAKATSR